MTQSMNEMYIKQARLLASNEATSAKTATITTTGPASILDAAIQDVSNATDQLVDLCSRASVITNDLFGPAPKRDESAPSTPIPMNGKVHAMTRATSTLFSAIHALREQIDRLSTL